MRHILITGGGGEIGAACARRLAAPDTYIHLIDPNKQGLERVKASMGTSHVRIHVSDLASPASCRDVFELIGEPVHSLVHMAGVFDPDPLDPDDRTVWVRAIEANLTTAYEMCIAFRKYCDPQIEARIVLCSSRGFQRGVPGHAAYSAAKGGVVGLVRTLSREFAPAIRVNAVSPGLIQTRMTEQFIKAHGPERLHEIPLQRFGRPEDVAGVVAFLSGSDSAYVTGQVITVDGGTVNA